MPDPLPPPQPPEGARLCPWCKLDLHQYPQHNTNVCVRSAAKFKGVPLPTEHLGGMSDEEIRRFDRIAEGGDG